MTTSIATNNKVEKDFVELTNILDYRDPVFIEHDISLEVFISDLGKGFGFAKIFDELNVSEHDRKVKFHLIGHNIDESEKWPTIGEIVNFGESIGYRSANIKELLYFCRDIRNNHHRHHLVNGLDVVASGSESQITRRIAGHYPMAPSGLSMSSFSKNAICPHKVVALMVEEV